MKLISLELTEPGMVAGADKPSHYPIGTRITLDSAALEKLGIDIDDYDAGQVLELCAKAEVSGKHIRRRPDGEASEELELQITQMAIGESRSAKRQRAADRHLDSIAGPADPNDE